MEPEELTMSSGCPRVENIWRAAERQRLPVTRAQVVTFVHT